MSTKAAIIIIALLAILFWAAAVASIKGGCVDDGITCARATGGVATPTVVCPCGEGR